MPFDVAFSLPTDEALAWGIIFGQMDGDAWDWERGMWKDPNK